MPSALSASRAFVRGALARVRSGLSEYDRNLDRQGAEIKVEPFDAGNVSTPAALVKLATSIGAARRHKANLAAAQQDVELEREKTRAEIARLRAEAAYNLGQGRQPAGRSTAITPYQRASLDLAGRRLDIAARRDAERGKTTGMLSKAKAGIAQIDKAIERDLATQVARSMGTTVPVFNAAITGDETTRKRAVAQLGLDPDDYEGATEAQRAQMLQGARARLAQEYAAKHRVYISRFYQPKRERYQAIIDEGIPDVGNEDLGTELPPEEADPLGVLGEQ